MEEDVFYVFFYFFGGVGGEGSFKQPFVFLEQMQTHQLQHITFKSSGVWPLEPLFKFGICCWRRHFKSLVRPILIINLTLLSPRWRGHHQCTSGYATITKLIPHFTLRHLKIDCTVVVGDEELAFLTGTVCLGLSSLWFAFFYTESTSRPCVYFSPKLSL